MPEYDAHHAVLTANLILDKAVWLHAGCQQLRVLLQRLDVDHQSYSAIATVSSKTTFRPPLFLLKLGNKEARAKKAEEMSAYLRIQDDVFAECRTLVQKFGKP
jgi:hypothetical protein